MSPIYGPDGISQASPKATGEAFEITTAYQANYGIGSVCLKVCGTDTLYRMTVLEARQLGLQLILQSEAAITNAIALQILTRMGDMPLPEAHKALMLMGQVTREKHAAAEPSLQPVAEETQP